MASTLGSEESTIFLDLIVAIPYTGIGDLSRQAYFNRREGKLLVENTPWMQELAVPWPSVRGLN